MGKRKRNNHRKKVRQRPVKRHRHGRLDGLEMNAKPGSDTQTQVSQLVAQVYSEAEKRVAEDPGLRPGYNCCATCAIKLNNDNGDKGGEGKLDLGVAESEEPSLDGDVGSNTGHVTNTTTTSSGIECSKCHSILYCSNECQDKDTETHAQVCSLIGVAATAASFVITSTEYDRCDELLRTDAKTNKHVSMPSNWEEWLDAHEWAKEWGQGQSIDTTTTATVDTHAVPSPSSASIGARVLSQLLSYPLTLAGIIRQRLRTHDCIQPNLTIDVIGASSNSAELSVPGLWQLCAAYILGSTSSKRPINAVYFRFIGPEASPIKMAQDKKDDAGDDDPQGGSLPVSLQTYCQTYDAFIASSAPLLTPTSPDIIVCFNPGFTCGDYNWTTSLSAMKAQCCPIILTSNSLPEAQLDLDAVTTPSGNCNPDLSYEPLFDPADNPWASRLPLQSGTLANDIYYRNQTSAVLVPRI